MKEIEERAKAILAQHTNQSTAIDLYSRDEVVTMLERMAEEQLTIDDAELGKELLYVVNKTTERVRKEVMNKACEWLKARNVLTDASLEGFKRVMEEEL